MFVQRIDESEWRPGFARLLRSRHAGRLAASASLEGCWVQNWFMGRLSPLEQKFSPSSVRRAIAQLQAAAGRIKSQPTAEKNERLEQRRGAVLIAAPPAQAPSELPDRTRPLYVIGAVDRDEKAEPAKIAQKPRRGQGLCEVVEPAKMQKWFRTPGGAGRCEAGSCACTSNIPEGSRGLWHVSRLSACPWRQWRWPGRRRSMVRFGGCSRIVYMAAVLNIVVHISSWIKIFQDIKNSRWRSCQFSGSFLDRYTAVTNISYQYNST